MNFGIPQHTLKGHLAMLGADTIWGLMFPMAKMVMAVGVVTPLMLANFRMLGAAVLFWLSSLFVPYERVPFKDLMWLAGAGLLSVFLNQSLYVIGVNLTSPGEASIITTTMPMWVMLLGLLTRRVKSTFGSFVGLICGAAGALMLIGFSNNSIVGEGDNPMLGDLLVLLGQFCYALYLVVYKDFVTKYSVITLMKWMFLFSAIAITPLAAKDMLAAQWSAISFATWAGAAYVVVGGTFVAYICILIGQKRLSPTVVGMYNYVQPIIACLVGVLMGLDRFSVTKVIAIILVFVGLYFVTIFPGTKSAKQPQ